MPALLEQQERQLTALLFQQASLNIFLDKLVIESPAALQKQLKSNNTLIRLVVLSAIARRHLHVEEDLIERLGDSHPAVQEAAHAALVRVARGTDFGPIPGASQRGIERSIDKWKHWLALQQSTSLGKRAKVPPLEIVPLVLVGEEGSAPPPKAAKSREDRKK